MKEIVSSIVFFTLTISNCFSQSFYSIWGAGENITSRAVILRFEVRDKLSYVPIENAEIEVFGTADRELANFHTNNKGIGILILKNNYEEHRIYIRITKDKYIYYDKKIEQSALNSSAKIRVEGRGFLNWDRGLGLSDFELITAVASHNYDTYISFRNDIPPAPGILEFPVFMEKINPNNNQSTNYNQNSGNTTNNVSVTNSRSNSSSIYQAESTPEVYTRAIWVDCRNCNGTGRCISCSGTGKLSRRAVVVGGVECPTCKGKGKTPWDGRMCQQCRGSGKLYGSTEYVEPSCKECYGTGKCPKCQDGLILKYVRTNEPEYSISRVAKKDFHGDYILPWNVKYYSFDSTRMRYRLIDSSFLKR